MCFVDVVLLVLIDCFGVLNWFVDLRGFAGFVVMGLLVGDFLV